MSKTISFISIAIVLIQFAMTFPLVIGGVVVITLGLVIKTVFDDWNTNG